MSTHKEFPDTRARVRSMTWEADRVLSLEFEPLDGPFAAWAPGAHIDLVISGAPVRQYSLCGDPAGSGYRVAVLHERASRGGSRAVHERLRPGDVVTVRGPRNHFELTEGGEYLFLAGGIGITPILPMVQAVSRRGKPWRLVYLGSMRSAMPFLDEVTALAGAGRVDIVARDESERADLAAILAAHPDAVVYACGPERMLAGLSDESGRLHVEYFAAPAVEYEVGGPFQIRLERSDLELEVAPEQSVLEAMREAGVEVLSDCEEGTCGSCETTVLAGEVEHRDFVLTTQERAKGDCMMVCVSRASCPLLVLDA